MPDYYQNYLKREHARLEGELAEVKSKLLPDQVQMQRLKKLKLAVKDQIAQIERDGQRVGEAA